MIQQTDNGLVHLRSLHSVSETIDRLEAIVQRRGLAILARINHGGDAARAGLTMPPAELLIFGKAAAGTPLMIASPAAGIDLPLKALAWAAPNGEVSLSYNSVEYLRKRHDLPEHLLANIGGITSICEEAAS